MGSFSVEKARLVDVTAARCNLHRGQPGVSTPPTHSLDEVNNSIWSGPIPKWHWHQVRRRAQCWSLIEQVNWFLRARIGLRGANALRACVPVLVGDPLGICGGGGERGPEAVSGLADLGFCLQASRSDWGSLCFPVNNPKKCTLEIAHVKIGGLRPHGLAFLVRSFGVCVCVLRVPLSGGWFKGKSKGKPPFCRSRHFDILTHIWEKQTIKLSPSISYLDYPPFKTTKKEKC